MFRRWFARFERFVERHVGRIALLVMFGGVVALFLFGLGKSKLAEKYPVIKTPDSLFALTIGLMTVFGLLLAFISIRGLFERLTTFDGVLREVSSIIRSARNYVLILGYYPGFGCVTLRGRGVLEEYRRAIEARIGEITFLTTVHPQQLQLQDIERIASPYEFSADELAEIHNFNIDIMNLLANNATYSPADRRQGVFITIDVPDYHFVCNETKGVLFVPSRIPHVQPVRRPSIPAEVLGMITSHVEFLEGAFEHYSGVNTINYMAGSIFIVNRPLRSGNVNTPYEEKIEVVGGTLPYTWEIIDGSLPQGLTIKSNTGEVTGCAKQKGPFAIKIKVVDSSSPFQQAQKDFTIQIG